MVAGPARAGDETPVAGAVGRAISAFVPVAIPTALLVAGLAAIAPATFVQDTWMTLVAGRELAQHGLPSVDHLTVLASGHRWVDQQWLAQAIFYEASRASLGVAVAVYLVAVGAAFALCGDAARRRGASSGAILVGAVLAIAAAPWGLQLRAQALALPLLALTIWLVGRDPGLQRSGTFLLVPVLCLWANIHGSVTLGAAIVFLCALAALVRERTLRPAAYLVLAPLAVFTSPYAPRLAGYYHLMLVDPPFGREIVEWQRTTPSGKTAVFFTIAVVSLGLTALRRARLNRADWVCLGVTIVSALEAIRGIVWFAFAALAIVTPLGGRGSQRLEGRAAAVLAGAAVAVTAAAIAYAAARPDSRFESRVPAGVTRVVRAHPGSAVLADASTADWLLWTLPALRGKVAYDVRFELLTRAQFQRVAAFSSSKPGWERLAAGYDLVVDSPGQVARLVRAGGWRRVYAHGGVAIAERTR